MFERFTDKARRVITLAQEEARMLNHNYIGTEHILLGLIYEDEGVAAKALESLGISLDAVRQQVEEIIGQGQQAPSGHIPLTPRAKVALQLSSDEALQLGHQYIGTEHILLGLIREGDGVAAQVLAKLGGDLKRVSHQVIMLLHAYQSKESDKATGAVMAASKMFAAKPMLAKFSTLLTPKVFSSSLDPLIGRENELSLVLQVLSRRTRNNPVLVGESASDKTALLEALAGKLMMQVVPSSGKHKFLCMLDNDRLMADGAPVLGDNLRKIFKEVENDPDIVLVLDDFTSYVSARTESAEVPAAAFIIKPLLIRGKLQIVGTTTADQYRRLVESDPFLSRNFQPVYVSGLSIADILGLLRHLRAEKQYRNPYNINITDDALVATAALTQQFRDRFIQAMSQGVIYDASSGIVKSGHAVSDENSSAIAIRIIHDALESVGQAAHGQVGVKIADVRREKEKAIDDTDFEKAAELRDREKELLAHMQATVIEAEVDEESILKIVTAMAEIPIDELRHIVDEVGIFPAVMTDNFDRYQPYVLLNDQPLNGTDGDLLGTDNVAAGLTALLTASRSASPFVVGLDAGWGMGKSTLLRQIEARLLGVPEIETVRFNAWTAEEQNALEGLIKSVLAQLDRNIIRRCLRRLAAKRRLMILARISVAVVTRFFGITRLVDELWNQLAVDARTRNQLRDLIQSMLSDWIKSAEPSDSSRALVVFIDDLDRCTDKVVVQVCEAVKLYLDAPGLVFVIACDLSVIARSVSTSARGNDSEGRIYLEKIVQVIYHLPPPDEAQLNELIEGYALRSGTTGLIDKTVTKILVESAGRNPRRIKRIINSAVLENRLNPAWSLPPLNRAQLVTAILLQHLYSSFYDLLIGEASGKDPIGDFLDYVEFRSKASNPPPSSDTWWSIAERIFERYGLLLPEASPEGRNGLVPDLERLERELPEDFSAFAHSSALIALLRGVGDSRDRIALHSQLMRRPLTTEAIPESSRHVAQSVEPHNPHEEQA